jgi:hypothetical protein
VHWFWSFSAIILWPFQWLPRWFTGNNTKSESHQMLNDLDSMLSTLQAVHDDYSDIFILKSVESVLSKVILHNEVYPVRFLNQLHPSLTIFVLQKFKSDSNDWADLVVRMAATRVRLVNFYQSLERNVISRLPDDLMRTLLSVCSYATFYLFHT